MASAWPWAARRVIPGLWGLDLATLLLAWLTQLIELVRRYAGDEVRWVMRLILREGLGLAIGGVVLGIVGSLTLGRLVASLLYGIAPTNPWVMVLMIVTLTIVATLACIVPARRAANVDVMKILSAP